MDCEKCEPLLLDELYGELDELTSAAVRRHVGGCARCGEIATAACDACGVHLCSVCGATPTCDDGDPCALRRYPHPDKEPLLCVDLDAWGRALG